MNDKCFDECKLSADDVRQFISDLIDGIISRAYDSDSVFTWRGPRSKKDFEAVIGSSGNSPMEEMYGEKWSLLMGINQAMDCIENGYRGRHPTGDEQSKYVEDYILVYQLDKWEEHYDWFGGGEYGRGLKIGKRLFFYNNNRTSEDEIECSRNS
jgi:hypothetical protein